MAVPSELQNAGARNIVIVDDDERLLAAVKRQLQPYDDLIDVRTISHGIDATLEIGAQRPDAIILDVFMPGTMNGIDLAEAVLAFDTRLPVILVTGYAEELDRARHVNVRVLSKPFDIAVLETLLQDVQRDLGQTGADPAAASHPAG